MFVYQSNIEYLLIIPLPRPMIEIKRSRIALWEQCSVILGTCDILWLCLLEQVLQCNRQNSIAVTGELQEIILCRCSKGGNVLFRNMLYRKYSKT